MTGAQQSYDRHPVWAVLMGLAAILPASLFLVADMPRGWMALFGIGVLFGLFSFRWALPTAIAVIGHATYLAACSSAWSASAVGAAMIALLAVALIQPSHRWRILLLIVAILVPLAVVAGILSRSTWPAEAARALNVVGAVTMAGTAALALMWLSANSAGRVARRRWVCSAVAALAFAGALRPQESVTQRALPDWRTRIPSLLPPTARNRGGLERRRLLSQLAALRAAGLEEANSAWVAIAVLENADPKSLRKMCFRRKRPGELENPWRQHVNAGRIACRAVRDPPELGADYLGSTLSADTSISARWSAALLRLRADLLVETGEANRAAELYILASRAGDPFALRNAARLVIDSELSLGPELAAASDPLVRMWLHPDEDEAAFWDAWNQALDLSSLQPLRRIGVRTTGDRDTVKISQNANRSYRAITSKTAPHSSFRTELPLPPGRRVPGEVHLRFRNEYGFRLTYMVEGGRSVAFTCLPQTPKNDQVLVIDHAHCARVWSEIVVRPAAHLQGRVSSSSLEAD